MQTKLTLRMDKELIKQAKSYAKNRGKSLSELVADYLAALDLGIFQKSQDAKPEATPPITASLWGILAGDPTESALDEDDYRSYLEKKHQ